MAGRRLGVCQVGGGGGLGTGESWFWFFFGSVTVLIKTLSTFSFRPPAAHWAHPDLVACFSPAPQPPPATPAVSVSVRSCCCAIASDSRIYKLCSATVHRRQVT